MGGKPRSRPASLVDLARAVEQQEQTVVAEHERLTALRAELAAAAGWAGGGPPVRTSAPRDAEALPRPGKRGGRRKRFQGTPEYWESRRDGLVAAMDKGTIYTGAEVESLVTTEGGSATFIRQVRDALLESKRIKKVTEDGAPWKKGMSPSSVRWVKS